MIHPELRRSAAHVVVDDLEVPLLDTEDAHHLVRVLRLRDGAPVSATDGRGGWRTTVLRGGTAIEPTGEVHRVARAQPTLTVGVALVKGDRPEWVVQKLTELGIDRVLLLHTERTVVRWSGDRAVRHVDRLRRVAREAVMQSRQVWMPAIEPVAELGAVLAADPAAAIAEPGGDAVSLERPTVLIGPEGGWSPAEVDAAPHRVALPGGILRAETAALVAGTLLAASRAATV